MAEEKKEKAEKKPAKAPAAEAKPAGKAEKPEKKGDKKPAGGGHKKGQVAFGGPLDAQPAARGKVPARLRLRYRDEIVPALMKEFGYQNAMQVPRLQKIVVNMGLGEAIANAKILDSGVEQLATITGQKPVITKARKSIANFKLRQGQSVGAMVTLRNDRMFEFLDRLVSIALPRVRDFKGVSPKAFDGKGNYTLGLREQIIFPEIVYDQVDKIKGMNITVVTSARSDEEARSLLKHLGMPFRQ